MAYTNFQNCTEEEYKNAIYNNDGENNKLRIWFNEAEFQDIDDVCENMQKSSRIIPYGDKYFSLSNLVTQDLSITLHDVPFNTIQDQVRISIRTTINEENEIYEDIPIGIYNIQKEPTTNGNKTTLQVSDNSVKLDFDYNAKPLLDLNNGTATLKQILYDICNQAGIGCKVTSFFNDSKLIGIYDNSISARIYVTYIAEQGGAIPIIDRDGDLDFVYINNLTTHKIPLNLIENYVLGDPYTISKVIYESGIIKYEAGTNTDNTLYVNSANVYIDSQEQINAIKNIVNGFSIDSVETGNILGDPTIDAWDLIQVYGYYDENDNFVDDENTIVFTTLANNNFTYSGVFTQQYNTTIDKEERETNVSKKSDETYKKEIKTTIDNMKGELELSVKENEIISKLNLAVVNGQGIIKAIANSFILQADNASIDEYGHAEFNDILIHGGNLTLQDDGTQTNASIKISVPTQYTDSLLVGDDLSGKKLKFNLKDYTYSTIQALTDDIIICEYEDEDNNTTTEYALYLTAYTEEETQDKYVLVSIREGSTHVGNVIKQIKLIDDKIPTNFEIELYENFGEITYLTSDLIINDIKQITYEVIRETSLSGNGLIADIKADYDYTQSDLDRCQQIILGSITPTEADYRRLDVDKNGVINSFDLLKISKYIQANIGITNPGKIIIDTQSIDDNIVLLDGDGNKKVSIGLYDGVYIDGNKVLSENKLYEDSTGSLGTITLDDDVSNYEYIEIFYKTNNNYFDSKKVTSEAYGSNKTTTLSLYAYTSTGISYQNFREIVINGTSIATKSTNYGQLTVRSSSNTLTNTNNIYIYKVVGYK